MICILIGKTLISTITESCGIKTEYCDEVLTLNDQIFPDFETKSGVS